MATQQVQIQGGQTIIAPAGQFLRAQNVVQTANILQNGNTILSSEFLHFCLNLIFIEHERS